ncbi:MAG: M20/M25/M40 family metallo-hydrolase [Limnochordia bacterium]|jgi:hypothetical protein
MNMAEISAERIMEHVAEIVSYGPRMDGSPASVKAANYVGKYLEKYGCDVDYMPLEFPLVQESAASLVAFFDGEEWDIQCLANGRSRLTDINGLETEAVFVGAGLDEDYAGIDCRGKIVFAAEEHYWQGENLVATKYLRAIRNGAAAFVFSDQRTDGAITCWTVTPELTEIPFVAIAYKDFLRLSELAKTNSLRVRLKVTGQVVQSTDYMVTGILPGTDPNAGNIFINGSHHETVAHCPGANDNASGNAIMLELAKYFSKREHRHNLVFLSTCAEECACYGMKKYIEAKKDLIYDGVAAFIIDQVAGGNAGILKQGLKYDGEFLTPTEAYYSSAPELIDLMVSTAEKMGYILPVYDEKGGGMGEAGNFIEHGVPSVFLCGYNTDLAYHTPGDGLDKVSANSLKAIAEIICATVLDLDKK